MVAQLHELSRSTHTAVVHGSRYTASKLLQTLTLAAPFCYIARLQQLYRPSCAAMNAQQHTSLSRISIHLSHRKGLDLPNCNRELSPSVIPMGGVTHNARGAKFLHELELCKRDVATF